MNLDGTLNVLLAARDAGVRRVIFAASAAAYGDNPDLPRNEAQVPSPLSPYALTKLAGEYYCRIFTRIYGLETVALRFFNIFGPGQNPESPYTGVLSKFITAFVRGTTPVIFGDGNQSRDFTYVANVVQAVLLACTAADAPGKVINIGVGARYTLNETIAVLNAILTGKYNLATIRLARATYFIREPIFPSLERCWVTNRRCSSSKGCGKR